jgi:hypothetical protein
MTKRRLLSCSLILLTFAAFAVWLEPTRVVWGWLRGEAFYQGRPTSWWSREILHWQHYPLGNVFVRQSDNLLIRLGWQKQSSMITPFPPIEGDNGGEDVLRALLQDSSPMVRGSAEQCLLPWVAHRGVK